MMGAGGCDVRGGWGGVMARRQNSRSKFWRQIHVGKAKITFQNFLHPLPPSFVFTAKLKDKAADPKKAKK
jgi:hypothetical protein